MGIIHHRHLRAAGRPSKLTSQAPQNDTQHGPKQNLYLQVVQHRSSTKGTMPRHTACSDLQSTPAGSEVQQPGACHRCWTPEAPAPAAGRVPLGQILACWPCSAPLGGADCGRLAGFPATPACAPATLCTTACSLLTPCMSCPSELAAEWCPIHSRVCSRNVLHGRLRTGIKKNCPEEPTLFQISPHAMLFSLATLWRWHCIVVLSFEKNVGQTMDHACFRSAHESRSGYRRDG